MATERKVIKLRDHPCNNCKTATRVSPARLPYAVYQCKHGFGPAWFDWDCNVVTLEGHFLDYDEAFRVAAYGEKTGLRIGTIRKL